MSPGATTHSIDDLMERASTALVRTDYFGAERLALRGLHKSVSTSDWERAARACMPLQEARRQKRLQAIDAVVGDASNMRVISEAQAAQKLQPGCYLVQPPLVALDGRRLRELANEREIPVFILTREPMTRAGQWPMAAVLGQLSIRTKVAPPAGVKPAPGGMSLAHPTGDESASPPSIDWFVAAGEALGDSAIAKVNADDPPAHQAMDLLDFVDAFPDHEKLHQRLEDACRRAAVQPAPAFPRRRPLVQDPYSF